MLAESWCFCLGALAGRYRGRLVRLYLPSAGPGVTCAINGAVAPPVAAVWCSLPLRAAVLQTNAEADRQSSVAQPLEAVLLCQQRCRWQRWPFFRTAPRTQRRVLGAGGRRPHARAAVPPQHQGLAQAVLRCGRPPLRFGCPSCAWPGPASLAAVRLLAALPRWGLPRLLFSARCSVGWGRGRAGPAYLARCAPSLYFLFRFAVGHSRSYCRPLRCSWRVCGRLALPCVPPVPAAPAGGSGEAQGPLGAAAPPLCGGSPGSIVQVHPVSPAAHPL